MKSTIRRQDLAREFLTPERCSIIETSNFEGDQLSIARARVEPGVTTKLHRVVGTEERYIIAEGHGRVEIGDLSPQDVTPGDVVLVPGSVPQRISNIGTSDLIFYCVCTPRFKQEAYETLE